MTQPSLNKGPNNRMEKNDICACCGRKGSLYCFHCCTWQCCKICEKRAITNLHEVFTPENPVPMMKELFLKANRNSREINEKILESEELILFEYTPVIIVETHGHYKYTVVLKSNYPAICKISDDLKSADSRPVNVCEGTLCAAMFESQWFRGQIISVKPRIKVKYIDFGNEEIVTRANLKCLPRDAMNLKAQAIQIQLCDDSPASFVALPAYSELSVACVEKAGEFSLVLVENIMPKEEEKENTSISPNSHLFHTPREKTSSVEQRENYISLKEGPCLIRHAISSTDIYITPITAEVTKYLQQIEIGLKLCQNAHVSNVPAIQRIIAAKFAIDNKYYRAVVKEVKNAEEILVKFIDFGNEDVVSLKDIIKVPDNIIHVPRLAVPVSLRNVRDVKCEQLLRFFQHLIEMEETLTMKLCSDNSYVDLYLSNGELLSNKINMILEEYGRDNNKFLISDVPIPSFKLGLSAQLYVHSILYSVDEVCASTVESLFTFKFLKKEVEQFCENAKPYTPSRNEVCFGQLGDIWHRCWIQQIKNNEAEVKMIDTGESAIIRDFRQMHKKFIGIEAGGLRCKLKDIAGNSKPVIKELLNTFIRPRSTIQVTITEQNGCNCTIVVHGLKELLVKFDC